MYAAIWRILPGPWFVRLLIVLVLLAAVAYALIFHVYPWVQVTFFPTQEVTVE